MRPRKLVEIGLLNFMVADQVTTQLSLNDNYLCLNISGIEKPAEMIPELTERLANLKHEAGFRYTLNRMCILTSGDSSHISTMDLLKVVAAARQVPMHPDARIALVADARHHGLLHLFASHIHRGRIRIFQLVDEAQKWCNVPVVEVPADNASKIFSFKGKLTAQEIFQSQMNWQKQNDFDPLKPVVWDLTQASFSATPEDIEILAEQYQQFTRVYRPLGATAPARGGAGLRVSAAGQCRTQ